ncbi:MAG TPA: transaldolase family protein, partial [Aggregatilineales bacterium]|nr:transaldolase family protein [Aggregatilineales bacterium]
IAYQAFRDIFEGSRFDSLRAAGAMVQRPLWASTSVKNPGYPATLYIDNLIGPNTVITVPPVTLEAFKHHGTVALTLETGLDESRILLEKLAEVGVDLEHIQKMLLVDGVDAFADSFEKLLKTVEGKREMLKAGVLARQSGIVGGYEPAVRRLVNQMEEINANRAIWHKDPHFWKDLAVHQEIIRNRMGWLTCVTDGSIDRARLEALKNDSRQWSHAVLMGMGGSSIVADVFRQTFGQQEGFPKLIVLDSTVPARIKSVEHEIDLENTLFIVASKSGTTPDTDAFRRHFFNLVSSQVEDAGRQFIAITDAGTGLARIAEADGYRDLFINPADIGGRYAALSYSGMVSAAVMGLDLNRLYASAERMLQAIGKIIPAQGHPGIWLGVLLGYLAQKGHDKLGLLVSDKIASFAYW